MGAAWVLMVSWIQAIGKFARRTDAGTFPGSFSEAGWFCLANTEGKGNP
jgi:hypothetical protein